MSFLGEGGALQPERAIPGFSIRRSPLLQVFSKLVELRPAKPCRTNTNLYRLGLLKIPFHVQSVCYMEIPCWC